MKAIFILRGTLKSFLMLTLLLNFSPSMAQIQMEGTPPSFALNLTEPIQEIIMPGIDRQRVAEEDAVNDQIQDIPWRFAIPFKVKYNLENSGTWTTLANGDRIWRLQITCPKAVSVNFLYSDWYFEKGSELYIYGKDKEHIIGSYGAHNNRDHRLFGTRLVHHESVILELYEPAKQRGTSNIEIGQVSHGYRGWSQFESNASINNSGPCQVDVNCSPEGDNWQTEKRSVGKIVINGIGWCSGALVNNTAQDCTPYFLTANHCMSGWAINTPVDAINAPTGAPGPDPTGSLTWVFYWNFERTGVNCNTTANGDDTQTTVGATCVANTGTGATISSSSDFSLLNLSVDPSTVYNVHFAGWDARNLTPVSGGVGIHHPSGDAKKIATHSQVPITDPNPFYGGNYWQILPWDATANGQSVTEGGSSGSPLFDANKRIVGQLYGGGSINCTNPSLDPGVYGKLSYSWTNGAAATNTRRLDSWLDPVGGGTTMLLNGSNNPCGPPPNNDCANALPITCGQTLSGTTVGATNTVLPFCGTSNTAPDVWYSFVATGVNSTLSTCSPGTNYDSKITIYSGSCGALVCEDGNDDDFLCPSSILQSTLTIPTTIGQTYYVEVHGFGTATGIFNLTLTCIPNRIANNDRNGDGTPDITDPCACDDPLNSLVYNGPSGPANGDLILHELVTVASAGGEIWNLITLNAGNVLNSDGTPLTSFGMTESPAGVYTIEFWHYAGVGYDADFSNGTDVLNMSNVCAACPTPVPTMGEWGLIFFIILLMTGGLVALISRKKRVLA